MGRTRRVAIAALGLIAAACSTSDDTATSPDASDDRTSSTPGVTEPQDAAVDASAPVDPCATKNAVCPTTTTTAGSGVVAIDRCAFPIKEAATWSSLPSLATALATIAPPVTTATILADLNRNATSVAAGAVPGGPAGVGLAVRGARGLEGHRGDEARELSGSLIAH